MEREKEELLEQEINTQRAEIMPPETEQDKNKELYLKYFPACGGIAGGFMEADEIGDFLTTKEKEKCIYCGNVHVRQYGQKDFFACEDCRKWLVSSRQEFFEIIILVRKNLEALLGIVFKEEIIVDCKVGQYQWQKRRKQNKLIISARNKAYFEQNWVDFRVKKGIMKFIIYEELPKTAFIFIVVTYFISIFFNSNMDNIVVRATLWNNLNIDVLAKWYAIHYMYLNGYVNFCRWRDSKELEDENYRKWKLLLGSPVTKNVMNEKKLISILMRKRKML